MQYMNNNGLYNAGLGMDVYNPYTMQQQNPYVNQIPQQQQQMGQNPMPMRPVVDPRSFETPTITMGESHKPMFSVSKNDTSLPNVITVDNDSDIEIEKKRRKRKGTESSNNKITTEKMELIRPDDTESVKGEVVDSTIYSYNETNHLLHETLGQIDMVNGELVQEFESIRRNRTMKNKYNTLNALSENIGAMISNRIATIKEINNCITKANDMDYKKYKDIQAAQSSMNDDKYIADLYTAFMQNPNNMAPTYQMPNIDQSIMGSGIIRANVTNASLASGTDTIFDEGYLNYVSNMTPEQNLMRYENNPNVKQVVIYDASTGNKFFQMMDMSTGEAIPNVPVYGENIMEDTTLDLTTGIAKNLNLRESFPIVQINNSVTSQY